MRRLCGLVCAALLAGACGGARGGGDAGAGRGGTIGSAGAIGDGGPAGTGGTGVGGSIASCAPIVPRDPDAFVHPGGLHKRSDMDRMRYLIAAGVEPWATAYQALRTDALASPTYAVRGNPAWTQV